MGCGLPLSQLFSQASAMPEPSISSWKVKSKVTQKSRQRLRSSKLTILNWPTPLHQDGPVNTIHVGLSCLSKALSLLEEIALIFTSKIKWFIKPFRKEISMWDVHVSTF